MASLISCSLIAMDNYLDSSRKIIGMSAIPCTVTNGSADENYDDYRLIDFALLVKNIKVALHWRSPFV